MNPLSVLPLSPWAPRRRECSAGGSEHTLEPGKRSLVVSSRKVVGLQCAWLRCTQARVSLRSPTRKESLSLFRPLTATQSWLAVFPWPSTRRWSAGKGCQVSFSLCVFPVPCGLSLLVCFLFEPGFFFSKTGKLLRVRSFQSLKLGSLYLSGLLLVFGQVVEC